MMTLGTPNRDDQHISTHPLLVYGGSDKNTTLRILGLSPWGSEALKTV